MANCAGFALVCLQKWRCFYVGQGRKFKGGAVWKSAKFREFYREKIRYFEEFLKFKSLKELNKGGLRFFNEANLAFDNAEAVKILLENGLCELADECEFLRKKAKIYEATEVLKLKF